MNRRGFLQATAFHASLAGMSIAAPAWAGDAPDGILPTSVFNFDMLAEMARGRAAQGYTRPDATLSGPFADLNYDQYRAISFDLKAAPWANFGRLRLGLMAPGLLYADRVRIHLVDSEQVREIGFSPELLIFNPSQFPDDIDNRADPGDMGWSGFRLHAPLNRPDVMDEFLIFQGASYFRAVARNTLYGLSARGLAIGTGGSDGEEFPAFTDFWIRKPAPDATRIVVYAMLDSPSVVGAFRFEIAPGATTRIDVRSALFPRRDLEDAGIAPLTSMYWFGNAQHRGVDDYRPAVHDSDGLQMTTGAGEQIWRSLSAPSRLQVSAFLDSGPRRFGLTQRRRAFADFEDAEAHYERRPSAWIEPVGDWGEGQVRLVEIPVENEFNDNIVAFWVPQKPLLAGERVEFSYRLSFGPLPPDDRPLARVIAMRSGKPVNEKVGRRFIVDFDLEQFLDRQPQADMSASTGEVTALNIQALPKENRLRVAFLFEPGKEPVADLRLSLRGPNGALSETWMYRWTP